MKFTGGKYATLIGNDEKGCRPGKQPTGCFIYSIACDYLLYSFRASMKRSLRKEGKRIISGILDTYLLTNIE